MSKNPLSKRAYTEWLAGTMRVINDRSTVIRPLTAKDFPSVDFDALWRQYMDNHEEAAEVAFLVEAFTRKESA